MKKIVILGSTGSLGKQALEVIKKHQDYFQVVGLSAHKNKELLEEQKEKLSVEHIVLSSNDKEEALTALAVMPEVDIVINVLSGIAGLKPTIESIKHNKKLILGNKESLIAGGKNIEIDNIIPIDSEHNAIYEIIKRNPDKKIKKIILPCSGGPFFGRKDIENFTLKEALNHPKWNMGNKINIESATLINKGLELIEAHYLFKLPLNKIEIKIHREAIVHGIVEFEEQTLAYISKPDMKEHIENALLETLGKKQKLEIRELKKNEFKFYEPDLQTFRGINIIKNAFILDEMKKFLELEEEVISNFLEEKISFQDIYTILEKI